MAPQRGCAEMSSYYDRPWEAFEVMPTDGMSSERMEQTDQEQSASGDSRVWSGWMSSGRSGSWQAPRSWGSGHWHAAGAENYELASNASEASWWQGSAWSWHSWEPSSEGSRENWVYVTKQAGQPDWERDAWHRWHDNELSLGRGQNSGQGQRCADLEGFDDGASLRSAGELMEGVPRGDLPSGKVTSVHERADKDEEKKSSGKITSSYPPVFKAKQGESYRDWKRAWMKGEGNQLPTSLVGPRVMVQLRERAAALVKHLEPEDVDGADGLQKIFDTLEASPLLKQSEKHRVDWHRKRLLTLNRLPGESLESYITRASLYRSQLQGLDASLSMGERFYVGHLLDHSRLSRRDKALIKTHAIHDTEMEVTRAMVELSSELEGEPGFPIGQAEPLIGGAQGEEHLIQRNVIGNRFQKHKAALVAEATVEEDVEESYGNASLSGIPEEVVGDESLEESELHPEILHAEHEALAMQFKAKQKMAEVKKLRNFFKKGDKRKSQEEQMQEKPCHACGEFGHWIRECPKVKAALAGSNPVLLATGGSKPRQVESKELELDAEDEWALMTSLCQSATDSKASAVGAYMVSSAACNHDMVHKHAVNNHKPHEAWWSMKELARGVILDLGCMRNVAGIQWANDVLAVWKREGRWFNVLKEGETFRFGDGSTFVSRFRMQLEATFGGKRVLLAFSVVPGPCPPLLSKPSHTKLGLLVDCERHVINSRKLGIKNYGLTTTDGGHYMMRIDEFQHVSELDDGIQLHMPEDAEVGFVLNANVCESFGSHLVSDVSPVSPEEVDGGESSAMSSVRTSGPPHTGLSRDAFGGQSSGTRLGQCWPDVGGGGNQVGRSTGGRAQDGSKAHGGGCSSQDQTTSKSASSPGTQLGFDCSRTKSNCGSGGIDCGGNPTVAEEAGEAGSIQSEEISDQGSDGHSGRLPFFGNGLEQRCGYEHHAEHDEQDVDLSMEEAGLAVACEKGHRDRECGKGKVEEKSSLAQHLGGHRGGDFVGPLRRHETALEGSGGDSSLLIEGRPQRGLTQRLKSSMARVRQNYETMLNLCEMKSGYVVFEIFAGCARLTQTAVERGWKALDPIDLIFGQDLRQKEVQSMVLKMIEDYEPDLVTLSPRCGPWSQFQRLNWDTEGVMLQRKEDLPLWRFARKVWDLQHKKGKLVLTEQPWQSEALHLDFMKSRPGLQRAKVAQCAFDLKDKINGKPHQKWTALDVNNLTMKEYLEARGQCQHAPGEHQVIEGTVTWEGKQWRRSQLAAQWTRKMCVAILAAAEEALQQPLEQQNWKTEDGGAGMCQHYALPVEAGNTPEVELRQQLQKVDWRGGQYDYVYFEGTARQAPYKIRQALAHLHVSMGHPSAERLQRMLLVGGANQMVSATAAGMKCQICEAVRPPGAEPKVSGARVTRFGDKVLSDSFYVWDMQNQRFNVTHMLDSLTEYHMGIVSENPNAQTTGELLQHRWCAVFGPPELFQTDAGKEYADVVQRIARLMDFRHEVVPPGAKWRQGQVERHGAIIKLMMMRVIHAQNVVGLEDVKLVATACFAAKNRMSNRMGLSPLQAITGRNTSMPHSVMEQLASGQVKFALNQELDVKDALRRAERIRAAAVDTFHWIDANEVLRKALHARSRPPKLELIQEGATVYVYQPPPNRRGLARRLQDHSSWDGPGLVVCVERHENVPSRIWIRIRAKVRSYPLEKIRLATPDEMLGSNYIVQILDEMAEEIKQGKLMVSQEPAAQLEDGYADGDVRQDAVMEEDNRETPSRHDLEDMNRKVRRMDMLDDLPASVRQAISMSSSSQMGSGANSSGSQPQGRESQAQESLSDVDEEMDQEQVPGEPSKLTVAEKTQMFENMKKHGLSRPSTMTEAFWRKSLEKSTRDVRHIKKMITKVKNKERLERRAERRSEEESSLMAFWAEPDLFETKWNEAMLAQQEHESLWSASPLKEVFLQEVHEQKKAIQQEHQELAQAANVITGKARLEYTWSGLGEDWKKACKEPLLKAVRIYFDHDAVRGVSKDQMIDPKKILNSRFVLTNKGEKELEKATLKARWVLGGHKDPKAGRFPTLAPTASTLSHNLLNWIAAQLGWEEDVTSAFLQGKHLDVEREIYVRVPKGYPQYILDYIARMVGSQCRTDVLRMSKGGFGLPESPRLWYLCYKETLEGASMKELALLPGVFVAHHPDGRLRAMACIHVDDTRYCGDETSQEIWDKVHEVLRFGDYRKATDDWVKFCGRWEKQNKETFEFTYCMDKYATNLQKMPYKPEQADDMLSPEEKKQMASILGQLNWMGRQGRYDLSFGVSHVQQLMATGKKTAIEWLNKVVYRAQQETCQKVPKLEGSWDDMIVLSASDAAFGAQPGGHSQGGLVIAIAEKKILEGEGQLCILEAASMKIQRVVRCSMSAEISMASTAFEHGDFVRAALSEILCKDFRLADWKMWSSKWPHYLVIDAKTGYDVLNNDSQTSDRKIQIDLAVLKQALLNGQSNFVKWVPGRHMIADGMTKWASNGALQEALVRGIWSLRDTPEAKELRHSAGQKRKLYKANRKLRP